MQLIGLEYDHDTGKMVPIPPDQLRSETSGWTVPLDGMPSRWRDLWQTTRKRAIADGRPPELAWYEAHTAVHRAEQKFRYKARKRFFRP